MPTIDGIELSDDEVAELESMELEEYIEYQD